MSENESTVEGVGREGHSLVREVKEDVNERGRAERGHETEKVLAATQTA